MELLVAERKKNCTGLKVPVNIQGVGFSVPGRVVTNEELTRSLDTTDEWIQTKTGIKERRYLEDHLVTSDLCVSASLKALKDAGVRAEDLDAIILTTTSPDQALPSTAMVIKEKLGADKAIPLDMNQTGCAGGIYSMYVATHLLQNESIKNVLIIGCEILSRISNPEDRTSRVFFGDAAGAMVLQKTNEGHGALAFDLDSSLNYAVAIPGGGTQPLPEGVDRSTSHFVKMNGREVWEQATKVVPKSIRNVIETAGLSVDEVDHFIVHQANLNIIKEVMKDLDVPLCKTSITVEEYANTGSATLFSALYRALENHKIAEGDTVVFSAIGAGFLWGSACFKYSKNHQKEMR
ncbi:ketoacyl-ACP synthase III [Peribacillus simplex]|uniref:3-oxoacyl-ACP synthase III family protein n=1 Tax=Peribacillus TaxID=2675229 RepID=UPI000F63E342|nr:MULTISPECIES: ketoacyl-ACP synthase III [Peribacillus]MDF1999842.1 ketoacyl-ACP synthase III [Peribacillus frigoritolerans]RRN69563.1 ketoacyl-ACP synthase III [Peribacillus simplex]